MANSYSEKIKENAQRNQEPFFVAHVFLFKKIILVADVFNGRIPSTHGNTVSGGVKKEQDVLH